MADATDSTPAPSAVHHTATLIHVPPAPEEVELARAFLALESQIHKLKSAVILVRMMHEDCLGRPAEAAAVSPPKGSAGFILTVDQLDAFVFVVD